jgi:tRNA nucleotidyltransferase (CCA-adding enzyme)
LYPKINLSEKMDLSRSALDRLAFDRLRLDRLAPPLQEILRIAAQAAADRGWHLYLVGGGVRDLLLAADRTGQMALQDLDLVVEGPSAAGVELAQLLGARYPQARLEIHEKFQTAALMWKQDPVLGDLAMDLATARTEFYPYPAANPVVAGSTIEQDLQRRDFTINAMALRLTPTADRAAGQLLDQFGGQADLQQRQLRVLHANSFIDDPTRMFRGARLAARLGLRFEAQTEQSLRSALASGIYEQVQQGDLGPVPALQTRLKAELKLLFQSPDWRAALRYLAELGALRCIHPHLTLTPTVERQIRWALRGFEPESAWEICMELLIASLDPTDCRSVCQGLQLGGESADRLAQLPTLEAAFNELLSDRHHTRPSQVVQRLGPAADPLLTLVALRSNRAGRRLIWRYQTAWAPVKPLLDGHDLKALGYPPGAQYKPILADLLRLGLDGEITDRAAAIAYVKSHYPQTGP